MNYKAYDHFNQEEIISEDFTNPEAFWGLIRDLVDGGVKVTIELSND